jgi:hypothetical protein
MKLIFGKCFVKIKGAKTRTKFREIKFYQPCHKEGISLYEIWISFSTKHGSFSLQSIKEGKVFFRRRLKNGMCVNFIHRKEIICNNLHNQFNITYSKYYIVFVTVYIKIFKMFITIPL